MKKRILVSLLVFTTLFLITGCVNASKEDMVKKATDLSIRTLESDITANYKNAKDKYEGNVYSMIGGIINIEDNFAKVELYNVDVESSYLEVHLNNNDLKKLESGQKIEFVGKISKIDKKDDEFIVKIDNAYIVSDTIEVTGKFEPYGQNECSYYLYDYYDSDDTDYYDSDDTDNYTTYMLDEVATPGTNCNNIKIDGTEVKYGDTITIKGKVIETKNNTAYDDDWTFTSVESVSVK